MPRTTSLPSRVTAPNRTPPPWRTSATSRRNTALPSLERSTMLPMSFSFATRPSPRTRYCSGPTLMNWPPTCRLFPSMAPRTSLKPRPYLMSLLGSITTWYCFSWPPHESTSSTPGAVRRMRRTLQSWRVRSSMSLSVPASFSSARSSVYQYTCPRPEELGPSSGSPYPCGMRDFTSSSRSATNRRAK